MVSQGGNASFWFPCLAKLTSVVTGVRARLSFLLIVVTGLAVMLVWSHLQADAVLGSPQAADRLKVVLACVLVATVCLFPFLTVSYQHHTWVSLQAVAASDPWRLSQTSAGVLTVLALLLRLLLGPHAYESLTRPLLALAVLLQATCPRSRRDILCTSRSSPRPLCNSRCIVISAC